MTISQIATGLGLTLVGVIGGLILYILVGVRDDVKALREDSVTENQCSERRETCAVHSLQHHTHEGLPENSQVLFKAANG